MKHYLSIFLMLFMVNIGVLHAQNRELKGRVTDEDGNPITGVTVLVKGSNIGSQTDFNGNFTLNVPNNAALVFSYIGYLTKEVSSGNQSVISVQLLADDTSIDEVVVTALGLERKKNELTYATQEVKGDELTKTRDNNFVNALAGKVAGLDIKQSGTMGGSTNVVMRGIKSMTGNNQALFVVDGSPVSNNNNNSTDQTTGRGGFDYGNAVADINPDDIESVTVLKGAAATALYGSRAGNGVVMITTKKGKKNSLNITLNNGFTIGNIDKSTFAKYQKEYGAGYINQYTLQETGNPDNSYGSPDGNFWYRPTSFSTSPVEMTPFTEDASYGAAFDPNRLIYQWDSFDPNSPNYGKATPWVAAVNDPSTFYKTAVNSMQSISFDGGSEKTTFKAGYTRNDETGVLPNSSITKNLVNLGGSHDILSNLTVSGVANFSKIDGRGRFGTGYEGRNPNQQFRQWWQTNVDIKEQKDAYFRYKENITWNWANEQAASPIYSNNVYFNSYENFQNDTRYRYFGNVNLSWSPYEWLNILGRASFDGYNQFEEERFAIGGADVPEYLRRDGTFSEANYDLIATVNKDINEDLKVGGLLGTNIRRSRVNNITALTNGGLAFPGLYSLSNSLNAINAPTEYYARIGVDGIFAAGNIGYKDTYFLDATIRRDQSTTLPKDNDTYYYYSVAGGFTFSNLIENKDVLNYGKVRLNYAEVGNDASPLSIFDTYDINPLFGSVVSTSLPANKRNPNLRPERTKSVEAGVELAFFKSRLGLDFSWYNTETFDQIMAVDVSTTTGFARKWVNAGTIQNNGYEVQLWGYPIRNDNFSWNVNVNFSTYKTTVKELYEENINLQLATLQGGVTLNASLGDEMGTLKGRNYVFENGEKVVGDDGYYLKSPPNTVIGNINPDWFGGINNTFKYKNVSLSFLIDMKFGGNVFSLDQYYGQATGLYPETAGLNDLGNPSRLPIAQGGGVILPGVKEDGTPNDIRVENYDSNVTPYGYTNNPTAVAVFDASYVKLRELALTYSLPGSLLDRTNFIKGVDLSLIGRNLWIIHKNLPYADPEAGLSSGNIQGYQSGAYPTVRNIGFNMRFKF